jgi:glycerol-1-phosphate dehydrogenase [NAD(P)+]
VSDVLARLINGAFPDPRTGSAVPMPIRSIVISETLAGTEADLVAALDPGGTLAVVSDPDTEAAMGARVGKALSGAARLMHIHLPRHPDPNEHTTGLIEREGGLADAFIAVGSGTINDLCKYAAARSGKPYAVFATAPSMNGYTSKNASITVNGLKRTLPAQLPVLAASPVRLIRAGVGDTLCRATVQADWLLAHFVRGDPYMELPFLLLSEDEDRLLAEPEAPLRGDLETHACLARALESPTGRNPLVFRRRLQQACGTRTRLEAIAEIGVPQAYIPDEQGKWLLYGMEQSWRSKGLQRMQTMLEDWIPVHLK